ncbi:MAG: hypothetical protein PWR19_1998 [Carnobacterium sp.]|uniref:hypothetical protein n=1 Tax=Carnobacterium sp. TaxID=48221 RepID=UPI0026472FDA|nr:hypothetical protein [Carnobacterium sp.]MDN5372952.1 hypothetical protein [Carnobacterium sp.]
MKKIKKASRMTLSFILMFGVVILIGSIFVRFILLNGNYIGDKLEDRDYYSQLSENLNTKYATLSLQSSIPEEIFMSAVLEDYEVQKLTRENVNLMVDYMNYQTEESAVIMDRTIFSEPVITYVESFAKENNIPFDEELQSRTTAVVDSATEITENRVTLFNLKNVIGIPQFQTVRKIVNIAYNSIIPVLIFLLVVIGLLALLYRRKRFRILFWVGSSICAGSIFVIVPSALALILKLPQRIQISAPYINTAIQNLTIGYSKYFLSAGLIALATGVLCLFLYFYMSSYSVEKRSLETTKDTSLN